MVAPWESLAKVPDNLNPLEAAPLMCAGVTVFNSLRRQHKIAGSIVAVQGIGGLGHYAIQFAAKMGYTVVAITSPDKVPLAKQLGATHVIDTSKHPMDTKSPVNAASELQKLGGATVIVSTGFDANSQGALTGGLTTDGVVLLLGIDAQNPVPVSNLSLLPTRGSVRGWYSGTAQDAEETMEFAAQQGIRSFIEANSLDKAPEMYARLLSGKPRFRISLYTKAGEKFVKPEHSKWQQTK
jgi:D-arabinose 1-dehydrogenase-like Zn-dependent alcohol dehydrogenase